MQKAIMLWRNTSKLDMYTHYGVFSTVDGQ